MDCDDMKGFDPTIDPWQAEMARLAKQQGGPYRGRGRVLKVKLGFNPNSSSVASVVTIVMWSVTGAAAVLNLFAGLLAKRRPNPADSRQPTADSPQ